MRLIVAVGFGFNRIVADLRCTIDGFFEKSIVVVVTLGGSLGRCQVAGVVDANGFACFLRESVADQIEIVSCRRFER